jgi:hypothetical protein
MIPTALSKLETHALQAFVRGQRVVECGALLGYSTLAMAEVAAHVLSIDRHEGYGPSTLAQYMSNIAASRDRVTPVVADCVRALPYLRCADRYFIDLDGTHETTLGALCAIPFNSPVAVHDLLRQNCGGVLTAILAAGYKITNVVDSLAFIERQI